MSCVDICRHYQYAGGISGLCWIVWTVLWGPLLVWSCSCSTEITSWLWSRIDSIGSMLLRGSLLNYACSSSVVETVVLRATSWNIASQSQQFRFDRNFGPQRRVNFAFRMSDRDARPSSPAPHGTPFRLTSWNLGSALQLLKRGSRLFCSDKCCWISSPWIYICTVLQ